MKLHSVLHPLRFATLIASAALVHAGPSYAAEKSDPVGDSFIQLQELSDTNQACSSAAVSFRESALAVALISAVLPKVIDAGLTSLSSALHKASGEDDKVATSEGLLTTLAYDYDPDTKARSWAKGFTCLRATAVNGNFEAIFAISQSPDGSAIRFRLGKLTYKKQLKAGRALAGMTMAVILKGVDGTELGNGVVPGPFVLSKTTYVANPNTKAVISTPWMPFPSPNETVKSLFTTYDEQCSARREAIDRYWDGEEAKAKADGKASTFKREMTGGSGFCGKFILPPKPMAAWPSDREERLTKLETSIRKHGPITVQLVVTETRDVNKFLLKVSEVLAASKDDIKTAMVNNLDPAKKEAARVAAGGLKQDYDIAFAQFQEKVRLYIVAAAASNKSQEKLGTALKGGGDSSGAEAEAEKALVDRAATFEAALTARKTAIAAANAADVSIESDSLLATFPST
jgi:hypothetical protein